jgi:hypothetical protein
MITVTVNAHWNVFVPILQSLSMNAIEIFCSNLAVTPALAAGVGNIVSEDARLGIAGGKHVMCTMAIAASGRFQVPVCKRDKMNAVPYAFQESR